MHYKIIQLITWYNHTVPLSYSSLLLDYRRRLIRTAEKAQQISVNNFGENIRNIRLLVSVQMRWPLYHPFKNNTNKVIHKFVSCLINKIGKEVEVHKNIQHYAYIYLFIWTFAFETAAHIYPTVRSQKYNNGIKYIQAK